MPTPSRALPLFCSFVSILSPQESGVHVFSLACPRPPPYTLLSSAWAQNYKPSLPYSSKKKKKKKGLHFMCLNFGSLISSGRQLARINESQVICYPSQKWNAPVTRRPLRNSINATFTLINHGKQSLWSRSSFPNHIMWVVLLNRNKVDFVESMQWDPTGFSQTSPELFFILPLLKTKY